MEARHQKHGQVPLAKIGPNMSLPRPKTSLPAQKASMEPAGRCKAPETWKKRPPPGHEGPKNVASMQETYQGTRRTKNMEKGSSHNGPNTVAAMQEVYQGSMGGGVARHEEHGARAKPRRAPKCVAWPRRAPTYRFHAGHSSRNPAGVARRQEHGQRASGHEGHQNVASTQEM